MKIVAWTAVLWMGLVVMIGCSTKEERAGQPVPVITEYKGQQGPFSDRGFYVVQRAETWAALWEGREAPAVDFTHNSVLVAMMGQQPTAGYAIAITDVRATDTNITAYVGETRPKTGDAVAQVITYPYDMVVVPRVAQPVAFNVMGTETQPIAIQEMYTGQQSQAVEPQVQVIRTAEAWQAFWTNTLGADATAPAIDFSRYMAAVVLVGRKPTAGYTVMMTGADNTRDRIVVRYRTTAPVPGAEVAQVLTSPYAVAILPASPQAVAFRPENTVVASGK